MGRLDRPAKVLRTGVALRATVLTDMDAQAEAIFSITTKFLQEPAMLIVIESFLIATESG
jgi:hypothetical protein